MAIIDLSRRLLRRPLNQLLIGAFVLVALLPMTLIGVRLYHAAWDDAWREVYEKHRLLAMNLASPLRLYVQDHQTMLAMLANRLAGRAHSREAVELLEDSDTILPDFRSLSLVSREGDLLYSTALKAIAPGQRRLFADEACFRYSLAKGQPKLSAMQYSPLDDAPTLIMSRPVFGRDGQVQAVLLAELNIDYIEQLRRNIHFGERGHSAIVDQTGHVIAHPNPDWMREIRDLSHLSVVQKMMAGQTGVTEFYSPFVKQDMVAGFTAVPGIGWGVMVPQPKREVARQVHALLYSHLAWAGGALLLAIAVAVFLARLVSRPLVRLAVAADEMARNRFKGRLPSPGRHVPREISQLDDALHNLISGLLISRHRLEQLNENLQQKVNEATAQLRETNEQLEAALRRADEFIGFARHDLRKPLAVIRDIVDSLQDTLRITGKPPGRSARAAGPDPPLRRLHAEHHQRLPGRNRPARGQPDLHPRRNGSEPADPLHRHQQPGLRPAQAHHPRGRSGRPSAADPRRRHPHHPGRQQPDRQRHQVLPARHPGARGDPP